MKSLCWFKDKFEPDFLLMEKCDKGFKFIRAISINIHNWEIRKRENYESIFNKPGLTKILKYD